ncbi:MAG: glycosyltransferase family 4 protein [Phycisphaeraceae bacterium]|nr:glycosyltransferase family 4 protein [Phycisphaeraceae bacterium]
MTVHLAFICNEPTPYRLHLLRRLSRELDGVQLHTLFTHRFRDAHVPWAMDIDDAIHPVFMPGKGLTQFRAMRDYVRGLSPAVVLMHGYNDLSRLLLIRWAHRNHVPVALRGDSNVFGEGRSSLAKLIVKRWLMRWLLGHVDALMPMGTAGQAYFRLWQDHRLPEFLCPYEPDYAAIERRDEQAIAAFKLAQGLADDRRRLLYCGRLVAVKRVDVLIDAFAQVADQRPDWDLVIAGDGELRSQLVARVPAKLASRVKWTGFLQFDQTVACYHACHVLVHPSAYEPWALVINEAAAAGLAMIATNVTGAAIELVQPGISGYRVPPGDAGAMADAMRTATENDVAARLGAGARTVLAQWRQTADPVAGVRAMVKHFGDKGSLQCDLDFSKSFSDDKLKTI